jgi:hypothetical protein
MPTTESRKSRTGKRSGSRGSARKAGRLAPQNLVTEIVDQITQKQARSVSAPTGKSTADACAFCLEETIAGSPYRVVLKCVTEDRSSGH